jgi:hypothetical protein
MSQIHEGITTWQSLSPWLFPILDIHGLFRFLQWKKFEDPPKETDS